LSGAITCYDGNENGTMSPLPVLRIRNGGQGRDPDGIFSHFETEELGNACKEKAMSGPA